MAEPIWLRTNQLINQTAESFRIMRKPQIDMECASNRVLLTCWVPSARVEACRCKFTIIIPVARGAVAKAGICTPIATGAAASQLSFGNHNLLQGGRYALPTQRTGVGQGTRRQTHIRYVETITYINVAILLPGVEVEETEIISHHHPNIQLEIDWESSCEIFCSASMRQLGQDKAKTGCFVYSCTCIDRFLLVSDCICWKNYCRPPLSPPLPDIYSPTALM